jgi:FkbH-like protein
MLSYNDLKKNAGKELTTNEKVKLAILGDTATQFLTKSIKGFGYYKKIDLEIFEADYNQIETQIMDSGSELYSFSPQYVLIYMSSEKIYEAFCKTKIEARYSFADHYFQNIRNYWDMVEHTHKCRILQFNFVEIYDMTFGNFGCKTQNSFIYQLRKLNLLLMDGAREQSNVYLLDLCALQNLYGRRALFDEKFYYSAKMALSTSILPYVAKQVIDVLEALKGKIKKCVVLDLDNTLWGGVIGDDGINNIEIGELGAGRAFSDLQRWMKQLKERGILLTVCSKNNENTAKEPFEKHPDMILHLDDITMFVANWNDKANNIRNIQQTLNIGMDSLVFIDDNPFERKMVKTMIPEINVPDLPDDPALYVSFLKEQNLFETASYSEEDLTRTKQYQAEIGRISLKESFVSIDDYLMGLEMKAVVKPFDEFHFPRIAQLTQRSNQFNLRTIRYTEKEIEDIAKSDSYITRYFTLQDKYGSHGLVSAVILEKRDNGILFVNTWLMSCRVLKRGMEEFIVNDMLKVATKSGFSKVIGKYIPTQKNTMVESIYEKLGFTQLEKNLFEADTQGSYENKTFIKSSGKMSRGKKQIKSN